MNHTTEVRRVAKEEALYRSMHGKWVAHCRCGWHSKLHDEKRLAVEDGDGHVQQMSHINEVRS